MCPHLADVLSSWDSGTPIAGNVLTSLWARQHNLTNIEFGTGLSLQDEFVNKPHVLKNLKCLKSVKLMPSSSGHWAAAAMVLQSNRTIDTVILDYSPSGGVDDQLLFEASSEGDPVLKLSRPFLPGRGAPLALRHLVLSEVDLRWSSSTVAPALDLDALKELKIRDCARTDLFLSALSRSRTPPQLQTLHIKYVNWSNPDPVVGAIDEHLGSSQHSLIDLWICLRGSNTQPKPSGILRHSNTLEQLFIDVRNTEEPASEDTDNAVLYSAEDWRVLSAGLVKLSQLGVPFPSVCADGDPLIVFGDSTCSFERQLVIDILAAPPFCA